MPGPGVIEARGNTGLLCKSSIKEVVGDLDFALKDVLSGGGLLSLGLSSLGRGTLSSQPGPSHVKTSSNVEKEECNSYIDIYTFVCVCVCCM